MEVMKCKECKESFASNIDSDVCSFCRPTTPPQDKATFLKAAEVEVDLMEEVKKKAETIYSDSLFNEADNNAIRLIFIHGAKYYKELTKKQK